MAQPPLNGAGRGGRGALLAEALKNVVRRPGEGLPESGVAQPPQQRQSTAPQTVKAGTGHASPVRAQASPATMGRGAILASLFQAGKAGASPSPPAPASPQAPGQHGKPQSPVRGRGMMGLQDIPGLPVYGRGITQLGMQRQSTDTAVRPKERESPPVSSPPQAKQPSPSSPSVQQAKPQALAQPMAKLSLEEKKERNIPPPGTVGQPVRVACNYIPVKSNLTAICQYAVSFSPQIDSRSMRYGMLYDHEDIIGDVKAFDGAILYLPKKLPQSVTEVQSTRKTDGALIKVRITLTNELAPDDRQCLTVYNIIFKNVMRELELKQVGRNYYDPKHPIIIAQHKMEVWPGYITAIQAYDGGLMLNTDISHKVLRTETVLDMMQSIYQSSSGRGFQEACTKQLVGEVVLTRYNNKTYRIDDISWDENPRSCFTFHTGEQVSFVDYYKKSYNINIMDDCQPLIISRPKKRAKDADRDEVLCLIPELCCMTGLTDNMRQDFRVMKDIAVHTRVTPMQRDLAMRKFIKNVDSNPKAKAAMAKWGLYLDHDLLRTEARQLPLEKIILKNRSFQSNVEADFGREVTREPVLVPVDLQCWMVLFCARDEHKANDYITMMKKVCPSLGIRVNTPALFRLENDRTETYLRIIRDNLKPQVQMVVCIFPTPRDDRYSAIKKLCCVDSPVPSQVINAKTIGSQQKLRSVTQKIALQINAKLGGELWALEIPLKNIMVVGIDVYHEIKKGVRSVAGFVASTNRELTRWYSRTCFQMPGQELMDGLKLCLTSALKKYHEVNHALPERIFIFRDGVGDGQLNTVAGYEVEQLRECASYFGGESYQPRLAVVIVQKRINTRIFAEYNRGQLDNPRPGTILDHTVTRREWYDFFLVSQHVRQGTVSPTHYIVVADDTGLKPDHMQRLSYKLTHLYYNWPGTVRVPAPCQYAHKLAYLVGQSIHKDPSLDLADRLFFL
ncbi:piwi-like protein 1 [Branchiostoma floridae]|uniref:Piwi-like protein 1 n=1 Tax=Branchiostoma floridae TaxID=7739 RepID=A0A9J7KVY5_BRAFL|nr:piwi-like protein 1 [Branchiostoma floridae]